MIPMKYAYLVIIVVLELFTISAFFEELRVFVRKAEFWISMLMFLFICTIVDTVGLRFAWWTFSSQRICGVYFLKLPIEEFLLFSLIFALALSSWGVKE